MKRMIRPRWDAPMTEFIFYVFGTDPVEAKLSHLYDNVEDAEDDMDSGDTLYEVTCHVDWSSIEESEVV